MFCVATTALALTTPTSGRSSHPYEFVRSGNTKTEAHGVKSRAKVTSSNGSEKSTKKTNGVPSYAVPMEPLVKYSQPDPLYSGDKVKGKSSDEKKSDLVRVKKDDSFAEGYGVPAKISSKVGLIYPYDDSLLGGGHQHLGYTGPGSYFDNHYPQEPEPIIEIIIKESNQSLPAPPPPPPPPKKKKKEPVQVYYVKYKKEPSSHYGGEKIVYEPPVPAITPPTNNDNHQEEEEKEDYHHYHHEEPVTLSPKPSTTLKAIIRPDSETYHGSGLHITFGGPKEEDNHYGSHAHHHVVGNYEEQSAPQPSVLLPPKPKITAVSKAHTESQLKKRNPAPFHSQTPPPQQSFFSQQSFSSFNDIYRPTAVPQFPQTPRFSVQPQPFTLPQHLSKVQPNFPSSSQSPRHNSPARYSTLPQFQNFPKQQNFAFTGNRPSHPSPPPPQPSPQLPVPQPTQTQTVYSINQPHLKSTFQINSRSTPQPYHTISNRVNQHGFPKAQPPTPSPSAPTFQQPLRPTPHAQVSFPKPSPFSQNSNSFSQSNPIVSQTSFSQQPRVINPPRNHNLPQPSPSLPPQHHHSLRVQSEIEQQRQLALLNQQQRQQHLEQIKQHQQFVQQQRQQQQQQQQQQLEQLNQQHLRQKQIEHLTQLQRQQPIDSFNQFQLQKNQQQQQVNQLKSFQQQQQLDEFNKFQQQQQLEQLNQIQRQKEIEQFNQLQRQKEIEEFNQRQRQQQQIEQLNQLHRQQLQTTSQLGQGFQKQNFGNNQPKPQSEYEPEIIKSISPDFPFTEPRYESQPTAASSSPPPPPQFHPTLKSITQQYTVPRTTVTTTERQVKTESKEPEIEYVTEDPKKAAEEKRRKEERKKQNVAALPDEVPEDLRQQLLSSDILGNADIQILDYDKIGDIPIDKLPPEALANFQAVAGSNPVPSIVKPKFGDKKSIDQEDDIEAEGSEPQGVAVAPPPSSVMEMKVVRYNPDSKEGAQIANQYVQQDATQLEPVVLNDSRYNRYLPLKVSGAQFPVPDVPELRGKNVTSVVVLAPVDYEFLQRHEDVTQGRSAHPVLEVQGVHFVAGDVLKTLVKRPTAENYRIWLEKENRTPVDKQSVVLLVIDSKNNSTDQSKEIFMYDIGTKKVSKLSGELSAQFVEVAESNSENDDLDEISDGQSGSFTVKEASEVPGNAPQHPVNHAPVHGNGNVPGQVSAHVPGQFSNKGQVRTQRETARTSGEKKSKTLTPR